MKKPHVPIWAGAVLCCFGRSVCEIEDRLPTLLGIPYGSHRTALVLSQGKDKICRINHSTITLCDGLLVVGITRDRVVEIIVVVGIVAIVGGGIGKNQDQRTPLMAEACL